MKSIFDRGSVLYVCAGLTALTVVVGARAPRVSAQHIGTITFPSVTNLAFGDADGKTIYFMARRDLYSMRVKVGGRPPGPGAR